jgi:hypothetical protein
MWGAISALLTTARLALLPPILGGTPRRFVAIMNDDGPEAMEEVRQLAEEEKIKVFINRTYDFEDVPKVNRRRQTNGLAAATRLILIPCGHRLMRKL